MTKQATLGDELLDDGCLNYSNDHRDRHTRASTLLADYPELATLSVWVAAAVGDSATVAKFLSDDPTVLDRKGGPRAWEPLLYACYSRITSNNPAHSTLEIGRLLLERGANPNAVYWWDGKYPFTALTGVCGEGERGPANQPRHSQWRPFAELLLKHGARPDDGQALYNRMFADDDELLEMLLAQGLNNTHYPADESTGGKPAPSILGYQLGIAAGRGFERRVRLLLKYQPRMDEKAYGMTPWQQAVHNGYREIATLLEAHGAPTTDLSTVDRLVSFCLGADRTAAQALAEAQPNLITEAPRDLLARAVGANHLEAARLILDLGFPVNAVERATALHEAGWHGRRELADLLIAAGADPAIRDREHYATPGDWAHHNGQTAVAGYLNSIRLDMFEAIGNSLVDRIAGIVEIDPGSLQRPFKEYHSNSPRDVDSLSPLAFARHRGLDRIAAELERLGARLLLD